MTNENRIDVHHHLIPPVIASAMAAKGLTHVFDTTLPSWTPELSIETMDRNGIATAIVSLSAPGVFLGDVREACYLARAGNEYGAEMASRHPGRFGFFAMLPMPCTDESCREAIYALDTLKADGVGLLSSTEGKYLGDPQFEDLMTELDQRHAVVFVHPNLHETSTRIGLSTPTFLVEVLCDTTRAATNLILSGTLERYPHIRWILAHAGGFLPYIAWRLSLADLLPDCSAKAPQGVLSYVCNFYFETALSPSRYAMAALRELTRTNRILFGSDYPFAPAEVTGMQVKELDASPIFDDETKTGINRDHALSLFPKYT